MHSRAQATRRLRPKGVVAGGRRNRPGRYSKYLAYLHLIVLAGILISASSEDAVVSHPVAVDAWAWVGLDALIVNVILLGVAVSNTITWRTRPRETGPVG
jgi:steroid 5-alpha reductase family enzyme